MDVAYAWIEANVPAGSTLILEGGHFKLPDKYRDEMVPQLRAWSYQQYLAGSANYLVASSQSYGPYLESPNKFRQEYTEYMTLFSRTEEVARFTPTDGQPGPELRILKVKR